MGAGAFPFDPTRLVALGQLAADLRAMSAPPMLERPVVVDGQGYAWIQRADIAEGELRGTYVHNGWRLAWAPIGELAGVMISLWGGPRPEPGFEEEVCTAFLTREDLRRHIADLQAIEAAL